MSRHLAVLVAVAAGLVVGGPALAAKKKNKKKGRQSQSRAKGVVTLTGARSMAFVPQGPNAPLEGEPTTALFALGKDTTGAGFAGVKIPDQPLFLGITGRFDGGGAVAAVRQSDDAGTVDLVTYRLTSTAVAFTIGGMTRHFEGRFFIGPSWGTVEVDRTLEGTEEVQVRTRGVLLGGRAARRFQVPGPVDFLVGSEISLTDHNSDEVFMPYAPDDESSTGSLRYGLFAGILVTI